MNDTPEPQAGIVIDFDPEDLTLDEMIAWEEITGKPISDWSPTACSTRDIKAIVYISGHRKDPEYTLEQAGHVKIMQLDLSALQASAAGVPVAPLGKLRPVKPAATKRTRARANGS